MVEADPEAIGGGRQTCNLLYRKRFNMWTQDQQRDLDAAINYTCNRIGGHTDEANAYQAAVDRMDEQCGEMDDQQFSEFSLRMFLMENVRKLAQTKAEMVALKELYSTDLKPPVLCRHDALKRVLEEIERLQERIHCSCRELGDFIHRNHTVQEQTLATINRITDLLALPQFNTLPCEVPCGI